MKIEKSQYKKKGIKTENKAKKTDSERNIKLCYFCGRAGICYSIKVRGRPERHICKTCSTNNLINNKKGSEGVIENRTDCKNKKETIGFSDKNRCNQSKNNIENQQHVIRRKDIEPKRRFKYKVVL